MDGDGRNKGLVLGDPYGASASLWLKGFWAMLQQQGAAWDCGRMDATYRGILLKASATSGEGKSAAGPPSYNNSAPVLAGSPQMLPPLGQDAFLSDAVSFSVAVSDPEGDPIRCG